MKPILLEIVTRAITSYDTCRNCKVLFNKAGLDRKLRQGEMEEYPPDLREDHAKLSDWIQELSRLYKHRLCINLIDVQSLQGFYKSLRHRIRKYPAFIVEGKEAYSGWDRNRLEEILDKYIQISLPNVKSLT